MYDNSKIKYNKRNCKLNNNTIPSENNKNHDSNNDSNNETIEKDINTYFKQLNQYIQTCNTSCNNDLCKIQIDKPTEPKSLTFTLEVNNKKDIIPEFLVPVNKLKSMLKYNFRIYNRIKLSGIFPSYKFTGTIKSIRYCINHILGGVTIEWDKNLRKKKGNHRIKYFYVDDNTIIK